MPIHIGDLYVILNNARPGESCLATAVILPEVSGKAWYLLSDLQVYYPLESVHKFELETGFKLVFIRRARDKSLAQAAQERVPPEFRKYLEYLGERSCAAPAELML
ncbi:MAG TPA: hypothetical protein VHE37_10470 [Nevskiaceae bacterium]|nr:hypothetical protein [Nevskiaceae bacterium]